MTTRSSPLVPIHSPTLNTPFISSATATPPEHFSEPPAVVDEDYEEDGKIPEKTHQDSWWLEFSTMILSTIILAALSIGLYEINGRPMAVWSLHVTPNALASTFMAFMDACLILVISSCMGQLKWINYRRAPRSLAEMQLFDDASRRSFPGTLLLLTGKAGYVQCS